MFSSGKILSAKLRKALAQLPYLPRALKLVWEVARPWTIAWIVLLIVQGLLPAATVYLTKLVVDGVVAAVQNGGSWPNVRTRVAAVVVTRRHPAADGSCSQRRSTGCARSRPSCCRTTSRRSFTKSQSPQISRSTNSLITTITCIARAPKLVTGLSRCLETSARYCKTASRCSRWARS